MKKNIILVAVFLFLILLSFQTILFPPNFEKLLRNDLVQLANNSLIIDNALIMKSKIVAEDIFYIREASNNLLNLILVGSIDLRKGFRKFLVNEKYSSVYLSELTSEEVYQVCDNFNIKNIRTIEEQFVSVKNISELLQKIKAYKRSENLSQNYG